MARASRELEALERLYDPQLTADFQSLVTDTSSPLLVATAAAGWVYVINDIENRMVQVRIVVLLFVSIFALARRKSRNSEKQVRGATNPAAAKKLD